MGVPGPFSGHEPKGKNGRVFLGRRGHKPGRISLREEEPYKCRTPFPAAKAALTLKWIGVRGGGWGGG